MKFVERSYSTKIYRPKPIVSLSSDEKTLIVATPWTSQDHGQKVINEVSQFLDSSFADVEVTSPFEYLPQLPKVANNLRISLLIANDVLLRIDNKSEFTSAVEVSILHQVQNQVFYAQIGHPQIFLQKQDLSLQPITASVDLRTPPLPKDLVGLDLKPQIHLGQFEVGTEDRIVLLASSTLNHEFLKPVARKSASEELKEYTQRLAQAQNQEPFWISVLEVD